MTSDVTMAATSVEDTTYTYERPQGTTSELVIASRSSWTGQSTIIMIALLSINLVAFVANLGMLICLLMYKQAAKKTINIFVCNQTVVDVVFSFTGIVKFALQISGYYAQTKTDVLRTFMKCLAQMAYVAYLSLLSLYM